MTHLKNVSNTEIKMNACYIILYSFRLLIKIKKKTNKQLDHVHKSITFQSCAYPSKINLPIPDIFLLFFFSKKKKNTSIHHHQSKKGKKNIYKWNGENILQKS